MGTPTVGLPVQQPPASIEFLFDYGTRELKLHSEDFDAMDNKLGLTLGFALVSIAEILGFLLLLAGEGHKFNLAYPIGIPAFFVAGLALLIVASAFGILLLTARGYSPGPTLHDLRTFTAGNLEANTQVVKAHFLAKIDEACDDNDEVNTQKMHLLIASAGSIGLGILCYSIVVLLLFLSIKG